MTIWGAWSSNGHIRYGADWSYAGSTLNVTISAQTAWSYSGNSCTVSWSGTWGGSAAKTFTASNGQTQVIWSGSFSQAYNSTASLTFTMTGLYDSASASVPFSSFLAPLPPNPPSALTAIWASGTSVQTAWTNNPTSDRPYEHVQVYRQDGEAGAWGVIFTTTISTWADYLDTSCQPGHQYRYSLRATNSAGDSGPAPSLDTAWVVMTDAPAAPTGITAARASDAQANVGWTNNVTAHAPYALNKVWRESNVSTNQIIRGDLSPTTSYSDTSLAVDRGYRYQVEGYNAAGSGYSTQSGWIYTTPAAASSCTATKLANGDIRVDWVPASSYAALSPVQVWHAANGVWDGAALVTTAAGATTWPHPAPSASVTHTYRVVAVSPTGIVSAASPASNTVILLARPNAPTGLTLSAAIQSGTTIDASVAATLGWVHNPVDSSAQSAYEVSYQVSADGGGTWAAAVSTGKVVSTTSALTLQPWANGRLVRWQARTWGAFAGAAPYSDWSAFFTFATSTRPAATITSGATCTTSTLAVAGAFFQAEGSAQASVRWALRTVGGDTLESASGSSDLLAHTFTTRVANGTSYVVAYQVQSATGLWSTETTKTIAVTYAQPPTPTLALSFDPTTGAVSGTITNPAPTGSQVAAISNAVYRDGVILSALANLPVGGSFTDPIPPLSTTCAYTVVAVSAIPSSSTPGTATITTDVARDQRVWLNGGPAMSLAVGVVTSPKISTEEGLERELVQYDGRTAPVLYDGQALPWTGSLDATAPVAGIDALITLVTTKGVGCYRDPDGRREFVAWGKLRHDRGAATNIRSKPFTLPMTRTSYSE